MPVLRKTLNLLENLTGNTSLVMALFRVCVPLCDPLTVGSYLIHVLKMLFIEKCEEVTRFLKEIVAYIIYMFVGT